jgi:hypothetical protein
LGENKMIKENRYFLHPNNFVVDLFNVDFITFRENEKKTGEYWIKFHIGSKECRYKADGQKEVADILNVWGDIHGKNLNVEEFEIGGSHGTF